MNMSSAECLRQFVSERLTSAAEEIFRVFIQTVVEYEEEIDRQRRLLDAVLKPEVKLQRIKLQQQHVHREQEVLTDQQLCIQERNSSVDQEDPEPPQIKEEQEEVCNSQDGEQLVVKLETDTFMLTPEIDQLLLSDNSHVAESQAGKHGDSGSSPTYEESDHQLLRNNTHVTASQDQNEGKHRDFGSTKNAETNPNESHCSIKSHINSVSNTNLSKIDLRLNAYTGKSSFKCHTCGKVFRFNSNLIVHQRIHTGERPFVCEICGNDFARNDSLQIHMRRAHTGERPYICNICGKRYFDGSHLAKHRRSHTDSSASSWQ
ncbi:zinc finger and SCAN domain-containing protein 2-like isoform X1 [Acanthopagrus latus]|uniref:zinc finger and SCAN domain-containing protein 2-like isoform X1 n=1 Tax=Acanthopagrus latus TaxID=8177 RepID=UPI00187C90E9|nr:zinc finger and SCAN domain-containing protein 2-like isoform X1 [Acanthopagrus latus]